jgi:VIT1/CCC1 family predicted Fe2+/Mn2+ transporter
LLLPTALGILTALVARAVFIGASPGPTTVAQLLVAILCGSMTYVLGSLLLGSPELAGLRARLRQRRA